MRFGLAFFARRRLNERKGGAVMPSPFPGMNPYLEHDDAWHNFHEKFLSHASDAIETQLGERYIVKADDHVYLDETNGTPKMVGGGDIVVKEMADHTGEPAPALTAVATPIRLTVPHDEVEREGFL